MPIADAGANPGAHRDADRRPDPHSLPDPGTNALVPLGHQQHTTRLALGQNCHPDDCADRCAVNGPDDSANYCADANAN